MSATSISALAADPILLEPSSSPSNASFQVAILSVGLVRTMLHPRVSESFRLTTSSLPDAPPRAARRFYEKCVAIACAWSASARDRQPLAQRQRYCGTS